MSEHNIRMVTLLTGDEFLAMKHMADSDGLSDSAFMRRLLKLEAQKRAMQQLSANQAADDSAEPAQVVRSHFHASHA